MTEKMMMALRQMRRLDEDDTSQDHLIKNMRGAEIVREMCMWEIGDPDWADLVAHWMIEARTTAQEIYED